ncbi:MAG: toxic anion resistance protein [Clostridiales bacterium]|uniref:toxic anion resistance protein n=1 Tax=Terrisporobacter sp. TaxID=1965305 RepID=UPI002A464BA6|nr:toxic anion resistance protein [Terrisporobacter sp.]MCI6459676.1 toxic anion resistance protein [Clostridium sp.]MDD5879248.1 toxic anion resistance protein [Clostridiales bacterium]MDD7756587.1 toxic anion resistance protein [Clostridiales bacterium]MDY4133686.1 toxic anion resistance protein [Terrisporobacter sp.]MDY4737451.1 toxic anion resistance protein [Terrisporobacter sp.]
MSDEFKDTSIDIKPELTFEPFKEELQDMKIIEEKKEIVEEIELTEDEKKMIDQFVDKIEISNSNAILQYGVGAQKKISDFSQSALNEVKTKDLGEIGDILSKVVFQLKNFEEGEEKKGVFGFFKKGKDKVTQMKINYENAENNIDEMCNVLENHQVQLLKDIAMLDRMYDINRTYFKELCMYILAGKKKLKKLEDEEIPKLQEKAKQSNNPQDAQELNDFVALCNRFEKKIHDLELTKMISLQMAPQIRLIQNNDSLMAEKIQSTIINTIPLWKNQMVLSLGVAHATDAARVQREVTDMTNELLRKNAEILKSSTIETAKESERGIVDIETLRATNESLISTLDEILNIQTEGRQKRREAEIELRNIEEQLKDKLINFKYK